MQKQNKDRRSLYLSIFIAFIMITSAFGVVFYGYGGSGEIVRYKQFKFKPTEYGYELKQNGKKYYFENLPQQVAELNATVGVGSAIMNSMAVIVTYDPNSSYKEEIALSQYKLDEVLMNNGKQVANAFTRENEVLPVFTCQNATGDIRIIEFEEANSTYIDYSGDCVRIRFDTSYNLKAMTSKLIFLLLGVLDG